MLASMILALKIVLVPQYGFVGNIPQIQVCSFEYFAGTILTPGTKLTVDPYTETYGDNAVVNGGMTCSDCWVPNIIMESTGIITINCEVY